MNIVKINEVKKLQKLFFEEFGKTKLEKNQISRDILFKFFKKKKFLNLYKKISLEIALKIFKKNKNILLQNLPTPRIYKKNAHGTSFHNDYLYGHGKKCFTVWVPLYGLNEKNSIYFLPKNISKKINEKNLVLNYSGNFESKILKSSSPLLLKESECVYFNSKEIHGSPKNNSSFTRYSIDFRIAKKNDKSSNKNLSQYYEYKNRKWLLNNQDFKNFKFLKYVCGNKNYGTTAQNIILEAYAKDHNMKIIGQEAEIERYGNPILDKYLEGKIKKKQINSIMISTKDILNKNTIKNLAKSKLKVFSIMQEKFLN